MARGAAVAINDLAGSMVNSLRFRAAEFAKPADSVVTPPPVYNNQGVRLGASCAMAKCQFLLSSGGAVFSFGWRR